MKAKIVIAIILSVCMLLCSCGSDDASSAAESKAASEAASVAASEATSEATSEAASAAASEAASVAASEAASEATSEAASEPASEVVSEAEESSAAPVVEDDFDFEANKIGSVNIARSEGTFYRFAYADQVSLGVGAQLYDTILDTESTALNNGVIGTSNSDTEAVAVTGTSGSTEYTFIFPESKEVRFIKIYGFDNSASGAEYPCKFPTLMNVKDSQGNYVKTKKDEGTPLETNNMFCYTYILGHTIKGEELTIMLGNLGTYASSISEIELFGVAE